MLFRMVIRALLASSVLCLALQSCDSQRVFEENREFPQRFWAVTDEPTFAFSISDSTVDYNLYYNVRNSLQYDWDRLFVTYTLSDSTGKDLSKKLVFHSLFDAAGRPLGESGLGDLYDHQFPILQNFRFPHRGMYTLRLTQFSRQDTLRGVLAIGVRVERSGQEN